MAYFSRGGTNLRGGCFGEGKILSYFRFFSTRGGFSNLEKNLGGGGSFCLFFFSRGLTIVAIDNIDAIGIQLSPIVTRQLPKCANSRVKGLKNIS